VPLTSKSQNISRRRKGNAVDPTTTAALEFTTHSVERKFVTPDSRRRFLVDTLDKGREHTSLHIS
jgi:hypothetical protein